MPQAKSHHLADFAVIFDMDGVLINSVEAAYRIRGWLLAEKGVDIAQIPDPHHEGHKGTSLRDLLAAVKYHTGVDIDESAFAMAALAAMHAELKDNQPDAGLISLLEELKAQAVPCAIASGGRREGVQKKLSILGLEAYFNPVVTAHDVARHKPDPEIYLLAAQRLGLDSRRCIVVEDSAVGIAAGRAAGCMVVGFTQYNKNKQPLAGAAITINDWHQLSYARLQSLAAGQG